MCLARGHSQRLSLVWTSGNLENSQCIIGGSSEADQTVRKFGASYISMTSILSSKVDEGSVMKHIIMKLF